MVEGRFMAEVIRLCLFFLLNLGFTEVEISDLGSRLKTLGS